MEISKEETLNHLDCQNDIIMDMKAKLILKKYVPENIVSCLSLAGYRTVSVISMLCDDFDRKLKSINEVVRMMCRSMSIDERTRFTGKEFEHIKIDNFTILPGYVESLKLALGELKSELLKDNAFEIKESSSIATLPYSLKCSSGQSCCKQGNICMRKKRKTQLFFNNSSSSNLNNNTLFPQNSRSCSSYTSCKGVTATAISKTNRKRSLNGYDVSNSVAAPTVHKESAKSYQYNSEYPPYTKDNYSLIKIPKIISTTSNTNNSCHNNTTTVNKSFNLSWFLNSRATATDASNDAALGRVNCDNCRDGRYRRHNRNMYEISKLRSIRSSSFQNSSDSNTAKGKAKLVIRNTDYEEEDREVGNGYNEDDENQKPYNIYNDSDNRLRIDELLAAFKLINLQLFKRAHQRNVYSATDNNQDTISANIIKTENNHIDDDHQGIQQQLRQQRTPNSKSDEINRLQYLAYCDNIAYIVNNRSILQSPADKTTLKSSRYMSFTPDNKYLTELTLRAVKALVRHGKRYGWPDLIENKDFTMSVYFKAGNICALENDDRHKCQQQQSEQISSTPNISLFGSYICKMCIREISLSFSFKELKYPVLSNVFSHLRKQHFGFASIMKLDSIATTATEAEATPAENDLTTDKLKNRAQQQRKQTISVVLPQQKLTKSSTLNSIETNNNNYSSDGGSSNHMLPPQLKLSTQLKEINTHYFLHCCQSKCNLCSYKKIDINGDSSSALAS
ncbi:hypothetical protein GJ496_011886 [Pomphorhynchus laevis]|nr:hypothetical protein GJ496_011886 [Pomphorhynchus laevis]